MSEILIRHSEPEDAVAIKQIYECPNAHTNTLQLPYPSNATWKGRMTDIPSHVRSLVAEIDGEIVGNLGFEQCISPRRRHVGSLGMGVKDHFQGCGVGSALLGAILDLSDNWLNVRRIELTVYTDNVSAIALYKKHQFEIEGESRDFAFRNGEYVSVYHMARISPLTNLNLG